MSNPQDYSKILTEGYSKFLLNLGGKRVPTPYRRNEIGSFQKLGPEFQGKSSPGVLTKATKKLAKEQNFNLNKASVEEIRDFMKKNKLGIDCSGFAYRMLNCLVQKVKGKSLEAFGLPHVGRTNVNKLTSNEFSIKLINLQQTRPGDLIKLDTTCSDGIPHAVVIIQSQNQIITYAHSSSNTEPDGVHIGKIENGEFPDDLKISSFNPAQGDGFYRLKLLS